MRKSRVLFASVPNLVWLHVEKKAGVVARGVVKKGNSAVRDLTLTSLSCSRILLSLPPGAPTNLYHVHTSLVPS